MPVFHMNQCTANITLTTTTTTNNNHHHHDNINNNSNNFLEKRNAVSKK